MNRSLAELALSLALDAPEQCRLRLAFGLACAERVRHFLTDPQAAAALDALAEHLSGKATEQSLANQAALVAALARSHPGSPSLDGCGHAAVSATGAVACALTGQARQAAAYAAYALVYGEGGYGAVTDPTAFEREYAWQVDCLRQLAAQTTKP